MLRLYREHGRLNDERWYDLIVILDDASSEIYYAQLVEEELTRAVMAALCEVIESKGLFCALYSDRGSHSLRLWKAWKTKIRFSTFSHRPWKSIRDFHIPTALTTVPIYQDENRARLIAPVSR